MIGIFDSGVGGFTALPALRSARPDLDILYLADRAHAPYGTKDPQTLLALVRADIHLLRERGAERILMACCTASTVADRLPEEEKHLCLPILTPALRAALRVTHRRRIALLATEATVQSGAFSRRLTALSPGSTLLSVPAQPLVRMVESGARDGAVSGSELTRLYRILAPIRAGCGDTPDDIDTLILGCTHFSHLEQTIASLLPGVRTISAAAAGAEALLRQRPPVRHGTGHLSYIST